MSGGITHSSWKDVRDLVNAGDAKGLAVHLSGLDGNDGACELRFSAAILSMELQKWDCAIASWDDGGRCWSDDMAASEMIPTSRRASAAMKEACAMLARAGRSGGAEGLAAGIGGMSLS